MNNRPPLRRAAAVLACVASLAAMAIAPAAGSAAAKPTSCGARTISVAAKGGKSVEVPVSRISVEGGATCREAIAVISGVVTKKVPAGWTVRAGNFKVPRGLTAEMATKGPKTVKFALVGGS
jgi:hypothetical protein